MKWVLGNSQTTPLLCGTLSLVHFLWSEVAVEIVVEVYWVVGKTTTGGLCYSFVPTSP